MKNTCKHLGTFLLVIALVASALAQQPAPPNAPSVERLRAHIEFLASDKLEGRRTGSPGANLAAEYIAREFSRYGQRRSIGRDLPGMSILEADSPKRYLQEFPYVAGVELGKANELSFSFANNASANKLSVGDDWMPLGISSSGRIENTPALFVGYGITALELNTNDYDGTDLSGKIAVALSGTPDGDNPHGQFARYEDAHWKAIAARSAGAKALLIIAREDNFKEDRISRLRYDNSVGGAGLPVVLISRQLAAKIFRFADLGTLVELEKEVKLHPPGKWKKNVAGEEEIEIRSYDSAHAASITLSTDIVRHEVSAYNVVGIRDGSDPTLKNETIVIGAHYDHLGRGGEGSLAPKEGDIHHGADDNASGVAGLLELARIFSEQESRPRRTIVFIAFSGEEEGLLGSNYYVNHPIVPLANTVAMINMDMIGRMKDNKLIVGGIGTAQGFRNLVAGLNLEAPSDASPNVRNEPGAREATALPKPYDVTTPIDVPKDDFHRHLIANAIKAGDQLTGQPLRTKQAFALTLNEDGFGPSDHSSFYAKQIPVFFFWTGTHEDYHKPSDTADKINYDDEARILSLVSRVVHDIDSNDKRPVYTVARSESTGRATGFRVYLGTIPNYADSSDGLLLDGVREDSPAARAGIKAGDRIVKLAGRDVHNVYDYTYALGELKAGQEYEVEVLRAGERLKLKITPAARK
jgi:Zn-dependent M28 family amino/carboxypeptidase